MLERRQWEEPTGLQQPGSKDPEAYGTMHCLFVSRRVGFLVVFFCFNVFR